MRKGVFILIFIAICLCNSALGLIALANCSTLNTAGETYALAGDVDNWNTGNCFDIEADDITLTCGGHYIDGVGTNYGINVLTNLQNIKIEDCIIKEFSYGINTGAYVDNFNVSKTRIYDSAQYGIYFSYLREAFFEDIFVDTAGVGIYNYYGEAGYTHTFNNLTINDTSSTGTYSGSYFGYRVSSVINMSDFNFSNGLSTSLNFYSYIGISHLKNGVINNFASYGINNAQVYMDNVSIFNCGLTSTNTVYGAYLRGTEGYIKNSNISHNNYGIYLAGDNYNITNNTIKYNFDRDMRIVSSSDNTVLWDNNFEVDLMILDENAGTSWDNGSTGNLWDNYDSDDEGCFDDGTGHCTIGYSIPDSGNVDNHPVYTGVNGTIETINCDSCDNCTARITNWDVQFGDTLNLTADDLNYAGRCIDFQGHNGLIFEGNNHLLDGTKASGDYCFYIYRLGGGSDFCTIQNVDVSQFQYNLYSYDSTNLTVLNSTFVDSSAYNWQLNYLNNGFFENIYINKTTYRGITDSSSVVGSYVYFNNLTITNSGQDGFYFADSYATFNITNFNISNAEDGTDYDAGSPLPNIYLNDGTLNNNVFNGIKLYANLYADNVSIFNNNGYGIYLPTGANGYIRNSNITLNSDGIYFGSADNYNIYNNTIKYNLDRDITIPAGADSNSFWGNNFEVNLMIDDQNPNTAWDNGSTGNLWDNYDSDDEGCFNDGTGHCTVSYSIPSSANVDNFPIYTGINGTIETVNCDSCDNCTARIANWDVQFGDTLNLTADDLNHFTTCIDFQNHNGIIFEGNNHLLDGTGGNYGLFTSISGCSFLTIQNLNMNQFSYNIYFYEGDNLTILNSSFTDSSSTNLNFRALENGFFENIYINGGATGISSSFDPVGGYVYFNNLTITNVGGDAFYTERYDYSTINITNFYFDTGGDKGLEQHSPNSNPLYLSNGVISNFGSSGLVCYPQQGTVSLYNVTIINNGGYGFYLYDSDDGGYIRNCTIYNNSNWGLYLTGATYGCDNYNITGNNITNNTGLDVKIISASTGNVFWNNIFTTNLSVDDDDSATWNITTGGNRWLFFDEDSEGCFDVNHDGICDNANVTFEGGIDLLPLHAPEGPGFGCGYTVTSNFSMNASLVCNGSALTIGASDIYFNCSGYSISGNTTGIGIKVTNVNNVLIENCDLDNFELGIVADPGVNVTIQNTTFQDMVNCTVLDGFNLSKVRNCTYDNCTIAGIVLKANSNNNTIYNNSFYDCNNSIIIADAYNNSIYANLFNLSIYGIRLTSGTSNFIFNNSFYSSSKAHADSVAGNFFNNTATGNLWDDIASLLIFDTDGDGLGDSGSQYPYNATNNANVTGSVNDFMPITSKTANALLVNLTVPLNNSLYNTTTILASCVVNSSDWINNVTISIWNSTGALVGRNSTNPGIADSTVSFNFTLSDGNFTAGCNATNILSQENTSANNSFRIDITKPIIVLVSPANGTSTTSTNVVFTFNLTDASLSNCSLIVNNIAVQNLSNISSGLNSFTHTLVVGSYLWNVSCTDEAGNSNISNETRSLTITSAPSPSTGGNGGGGGGGSATMNYGIYLDKLCLRETSTIQLDSPVSGDLIISSNKDDKWFFVDSLKVVNGKASFMPSKEGEYKFDFKIAGKLAGSVERDCSICSMNRPFDIPESILTDPSYEEPEAVKEINVEDLTGYDALSEDEKEQMKSAVGMATFYETALKNEKIGNYVKIGVCVVGGLIILFLINIVLRRLLRKRRTLKQHEKQLEKLKKQFKLINK